MGDGAGLGPDCGRTAGTHRRECESTVSQLGKHISTSGNRQSINLWFWFWSFNEPIPHIQASYSDPYPTQAPSSQDSASRAESDSPAGSHLLRIQAELGAE